MLLHYWESLPKFMRVICYWIVGIFTVLGLLIGLKQSFFASVLIFLLVGIINAAITVGAYYAVVLGSRKAAQQKIDSLYQQKGYCAELCQLSEQVFIMGELRLKLQRTFFYLMMEDYENANKYLRVLNDAHGTQREMAMVTTMRMWYMAMNGQMERAESLFLEAETRQNQAYEMMRDLSPQYSPQMDDALVYFLLASAMSIRVGGGERLNDYKSAFGFQVSKRCAADQSMYPRIYDLVMLYAYNQFEKASAAEHSLLAEIQTSTAIPYSRREDLTRMVNQARVFARYVEVVTKERKSRISPEEQRINAIEGLSQL